MNIIYSTLTNDTAYAVYANNTSKDLPVIERSILIRGGANRADKHYVTPLGVTTEVTDEELAILQNDYHFKRHVENGFIKIEKKNVNVEKVVLDMQNKDKSAPLTPDDADIKDHIMETVKTKRK